MTYKDKEERMAYDRKYREDNKEKRLLQQREWSKRNPDYQKEYRKTNGETKQ